MSLGESVSSGPFFKAYLANLLPGQFVQPFIDAAFSDLGLDPNDLAPLAAHRSPDRPAGHPAAAGALSRAPARAANRIELPDAITGNPGDPRYPVPQPPPRRHPGTTAGAAGDRPPPAAAPTPPTPAPRAGRAAPGAGPHCTSREAPMTAAQPDRAGHGWCRRSAPWCCCARAVPGPHHGGRPTSTTATASSSATRSASSGSRSARSSRSNRRPSASRSPSGSTASTRFPPTPRR